MTAAVVPKQARSLRVEHCMGTVFTIDIRDPGPWDAAVESAVTWLHHVDATLSTYRSSSDISRVRRGELRLTDAEPMVAEVLDRCAQAQRETGGYFTAQPYGALDPTGLVKGWAIERASQLLRDHGSANHAVNGGGDIQLAGFAAPGRPWEVGIVDPHNRARVITTVSGCDLAVATSGVAERGRHIVNPFDGKVADGLASVTVVAESLTAADAYATAVFAMGERGVDWVAARPGCEAMLVTAPGIQLRTAGWDATAAAAAR